MRNLNIYVIVFFLSMSCANKKSSQMNKNIICNENDFFKELFFKHLNYLDSYYESSGIVVYNTDDSFEEKIRKLDKENSDYYNALSFFSKFPGIDYKYIGTYTGRIPYKIYLNEKKIWLEWYEKNKCNNIQW